MVARRTMDRVHELGGRRSGPPVENPVHRRTATAVDDRGRRSLNTVWRPDGEEIIVTRGSGATLRGRSVSNNLRMVCADPRLRRQRHGDCHREPALQRRWAAHAAAPDRAGLVWPGGTAVISGDERTDEGRKRGIHRIRFDWTERQRPPRPPDSSVRGRGQYLAGWAMAGVSGGRQHLSASVSSDGHGHDADAHRQAQGETARDANQPAGRQLPALAKRRDARVRQRAAVFRL